jgi:serine/threonine-protein kinase RsbW
MDRMIAVNSAPASPSRHPSVAGEQAISGGEADLLRSVSGPAGVLRWRRVFPGVEAQVRELRCWLQGLLPDRAARYDVITVATELAANAVRHSASGRTGGLFVAEVTWYGSLVRIAVADGGGPSHPRVVEMPYTAGRMASTNMAADCGWWRRCQCVPG